MTKTITREHFWLYQAAVADVGTHPNRSAFECWLLDKLAERGLLEELVARASDALDFERAT